jgi:PKD repeat protein
MVAFSSEGTSGLPGSRLTYRWDFGDGATSRQANPVHRYRSGRARTFTAKLTVTAADGPDRGQRDTATVSVTVGSTPPVPTILAPVEGMAVGVGQTVVYEGSATDAEEGPLGSEALRWTVLLHHNEHVHTVAETTGERGQFVVEDHGAGRFGYEVVLTARDESGLEASTSAQVRVGGVSVAPSSVSFGSIVVRQRSSDETVTVRNAGSERLRLQTLKLDGADVNQFRKSADGCSGKTLGPGQACTVKVRFQPTTVGEQRAELLVPTDDPNAEPVSIPLDGTGVSARLAVTDR